jgi:hypothetical protein
MRYVTVANMNVAVVEYNNERVLTTEQVSDGFECESKQIKQNYNNNKERFVEGKHFYKLEGDDLKNLRVENFDLQISPMTRSLYLWTKRGVARHSKMLGTDRAWDMFDCLEENYFNPQTKSMSQLDILVESAKALQAHERELARLRMDNEEIRKEQKIQSSRIDIFNGVCVEGTKRQKLVKMINAYIAKKGLTFHEGWHHFKVAYNTAFHTSIGNSISYYVKENGLKEKPTVPEFLEIKGLLDDGLRVADKLLNDGTNKD